MQVTKNSPFWKVHAAHIHVILSNARSLLLVTRFLFIHEWEEETEKSGISGNFTSIKRIFCSSKRNNNKRENMRLREKLVRIEGLQRFNER